MTIRIRLPKMDGGESSAKKDTRGGGIGCRALRLLRERFSLAGMQILAGTPPRVWAFAWYLRCTEISLARQSCKTARLSFSGRCPLMVRATSRHCPLVSADLMQPLCRSGSDWAHLSF